VGVHVCSGRRALWRRVVTRARTQRHRHRFDQRAVRVQLVSCGHRHRSGALAPDPAAMRRPCDLLSMCFPPLLPCTRRALPAARPADEIRTPPPAARRAFAASSTDRNAAEHLGHGPAESTQKGMHGLC